MTARKPHEELQVPEGTVAGPTLEAAWKAAALRTHPDRPGGSHEAFVRAKQAYEALRRGVPEAPAWLRSKPKPPKPPPPPEQPPNPYEHWGRYQPGGMSADEVRRHFKQSSEPLRSEPLGERDFVTGDPWSANYSDKVRYGTPQGYRTKDVQREYDEIFESLDARANPFFGSESFSFQEPDLRLQELERLNITYYSIKENLKSVRPGAYRDHLEQQLRSTKYDIDVLATSIREDPL